MKAEIVVTIPGREPLVFPVTPGDQVIGRADSCDIAIPSRFVSSQHASIGLRVVVRDLGSTNGTWIGDNKVADAVLADGDMFHFGWPDEVSFRVRVRPGDGTANVDLASSTDRLLEDLESERKRSSRLEEENLALQGQLQAQQGSQLIYGAAGPAGVESRKAEVGESDAGEAGGAELEAAVGERDRRIRELEAALEARGAELAARSAEVEDLQERLNASGGEEVREDSVSEAAESQSAGGPPTDPTAASPGEAPAPDSEVSDGQAALVSSFAAESGLQLEGALLNTMAARSNLLDDAGFVLGKLLSFSRGVEKLVSAMALDFRGSSAAQKGNVTMLPGDRRNIRRSVQGLLVQGGAELRTDFEDHLDRLNGWYVGCMSAYRGGVELWYEQLLEQLNPMRIQADTTVSAVERWLGYQYRHYWNAYRKRLQDATHDIAMDEIHQYAAREAARIADSSARVERGSD